mmetsp:Transcript_25525/g.53784  ORF Transcript_25525/g.53784 Transcript_25525/m.53784 type:complete len:499 (-) Transcript_25525:445-1941(-)
MSRRQAQCGTTSATQAEPLMLHHYPQNKATKSAGSTASTPMPSRSNGTTSTTADPDANANAIYIAGTKKRRKPLSSSTKFALRSLLGCIALCTVTTYYMHFHKDYESSEWQKRSALGSYNFDDAPRELARQATATVATASQAKSKAAATSKLTAGTTRALMGDNTGSELSLQQQQAELVPVSTDETEVTKTSIAETEPPLQNAFEKAPPEALKTKLQQQKASKKKSNGQKTSKKKAKAEVVPRKNKSEPAWKNGEAAKAPKKNAKKKQDAAPPPTAQPTSSSTAATTWVSTLEPEPVVPQKSREEQKATCLNRYGGLARKISTERRELRKQRRLQLTTNNDQDRTKSTDEMVLVIASVPIDRRHAMALWSELECFASSFDHVVISTAYWSKTVVARIVEEARLTIPHFQSNNSNSNNNSNNNARVVTIEFVTYDNKKYDAGLWCDALMGIRHRYEQFALVNDSIFALKQYHNITDALGTINKFHNNRIIDNNNNNNNN